MYSQLSLKLSRLAYKGRFFSNNFEPSNSEALKLLRNISLKPYNTFGIDVKAQYFGTFADVEELKELLHEAHRTKNQKTILGGGSNILFTKDVNGYVLKNELKGIHLIKEDKHHYYVKVAAGENWHRFVMHCIKHNYAGLENLSLIPGDVGASPMQNIGAYGVELKDVFENLEALHIADGMVHTFSANDCTFGYRDSIFKRKQKDAFAILNVTFRLNKEPVFNTSYGAVEQELEIMGVKELSIQAISQAVINIRRSKLPDPADIGNAGSFFKNPTITLRKLHELEKHELRKHELHELDELRRIANSSGAGTKNIIPHYKVDAEHVKVPAAWLIEQCGPNTSSSWKGHREGDAGVHARQALVLVNYGNATGESIYTLSTKIVESVKKEFAIELEREVNVV